MYENGCMKAGHKKKFDLFCKLLMRWEVTYSEKVPCWAFVESSILYIGLSCQIFRWTYRSLHSFDSEIRGQVCCVWWNQYQSEKPPNCTNDSSWQRARWKVQGLLQKWSSCEPEWVIQAEFIIRCRLVGCYRLRLHSEVISWWSLHVNRTPAMRRKSGYDVKHETNSQKTK